MEISYRPEDSMRALINLGVQGHFPLFLDRWINEFIIKEKKSCRITGSERARAKKLFHRVSKHKSLEHKIIIVHSMSDEERSLFIKAFFKLVEGKILDLKPEIH